MDYGTLIGPKSTRGSIRSWVNYDPLDVEGVLLDAQAYIYGALRTREMVSSAPVALTSGSGTAPLPTNFLDPMKLTLQNGIELSPLSPEDLDGLRYYDDAGTLQSATPTAYSIFDELIQLDAKAQGTETARCLYYKRPDYLCRTISSNFLTTRYPNLLRVACLMHGADQLQDDSEYARWKARTDELLARASVEADLVGRGRDYTASVR